MAGTRGIPGYLRTDVARALHKGIRANVSVTKAPRVASLKGAAHYVSTRTGGRLQSAWPGRHRGAKMLVSLKAVNGKKSQILSTFRHEVGHILTTPGMRKRASKQFLKGTTPSRAATYGHEYLAWARAVKFSPNKRLNWGHVGWSLRTYATKIYGPTAGAKRAARDVRVLRRYGDRMRKAWATRRAKYGKSGRGASGGRRRRK